MKHWMPMILALCLYGPAWAAPDAGLRAWLLQLQQRVRQHPEMRAALNGLEAERWQARALEKPLYNPELEGEFDREGADNNLRVGLSQTVDLWNKRSVRSRQGERLQQAADWQWQETLQRQTVAALQALLQWEMDRRRWELAREQERQTLSLLKWVDRRLAAGDLGEIDAELAYLELSGRLQQTAAAQVALVEAQRQVEALLPGWQPEEGAVPAAFWQWLEKQQSTTVEQVLAAHPGLLALQGRWQQQEAEAELAELERKPEPTIGIAAGRVEGERAIGLNLSIPLNIRNDYRAEAQMAAERAAGAEADWLAARRSLQYRLRALQDNLAVLQQHLQRWRERMADRLERSGRLLLSQWQNGDLSTAEYLLALDKRIEARLAGLELEQHYRRTQLAWLADSAALVEWKASTEQNP